MASHNSSFIHIDYRDTIRKSDRLSDLAAGVKSVAESGCQRVRQTCNIAWKGSSGREFDKKTNQLETKIVKRAKELERITSSLKKKAERYQYLENRAKEIFS